jgi:hypothetical protein
VRHQRAVSGVIFAAVGVLALSVAPLASQASGTEAQPAAPFLQGDSKTNCVYPANGIANLEMLSNLTGATYNCVLLFNNDKPTWSDWVWPWWVTPPSADTAWNSWLQAAPGRRIIISQPMVPEDAPANWEALGAAGDYDSYATQLAENLVANGMGNSIIRLGWEANAQADPENQLGTDASTYADWAQYWDNIVTSMRAVPGADFQFDWTVNQYWQPIPFSEWYPGNNYVDIIGIDAYDTGMDQTYASPEQRWLDLYNEKDGLAALAAFAAANGKPMSIPEWSLGTPAIGGANDDPTYVQGLGQFIAANDVEYNSYFYGGTGNNLVYLPNAPLSVAAYKQYFPGAGGAPTTTTVPPTTTTVPPTTTTAPTTTTVPPTTTTTVPTTTVPPTTQPHRPPG